MCLGKAHLLGYSPLLPGLSPPREALFALPRVDLIFFFFSLDILVSPSFPQLFSSGTHP